MEKKGNGGQMLTVEWIIIKAMARACLRQRSNKAIPQVSHSQREHRKKLWQRTIEMNKLMVLMSSIKTHWNSLLLVYTWQPRCSWAKIRPRNWLFRSHFYLKSPSPKTQKLIDPQAEKEMSLLYEDTILLRRISFPGLQAWGCKCEKGEDLELKWWIASKFVRFVHLLKRSLDLLYMKNKRKLTISQSLFESLFCSYVAL